MGNTLLTPKMIAREALLRLKESLIISNLVYRDYSGEFTKVGDTVNIRKPATFVADEFGGTINLQDVGEGSVPVKMDTIADVSVEITSKQQTLELQDFMSQIGDGAMLAMAQKVNRKVAEVAGKQIPFYTGTSGNTPNSLPLGFINPKVKLDENFVPNANRMAVFDPVAQGSLLALDVVNNADKSGSTQGLREANMGRIMGFDTYMDQVIKTHTAGGYTVLNDVTVTAITHDEDDANVSILTLTSDAGTSTETLKAGDLFTVDGHQYVVISDSSAAVSGVASNIKVHPKFHVDAVGSLADDAVTFADQSARAHVSNLAFHKNAIALVSRPLEMPMGKTEQNAYVAQDPISGLSIRVVMDYSIDTKKSIISFDALFGTKVIFPQLGCQILG